MVVMGFVEAASDLQMKEQFRQSVIGYDKM